MDLLKYTLLICLAPIWVPFVKELWQEFLLAMRTEGGLFKAPPSPMERKKLEEELEGEEMRVVSEELPTFTRPDPRGVRAPLPGTGPQTGIVRRPFAQSSGRGFRR